MERLLIEAEGRIDRGSPDLDILAARLESVIVALETGSLKPTDESVDVTAHLKTAVGDLRRLRPTQGQPPS